MAHIATVKILVDESNEATVFDGINEILRDAQMGGPNGECRNWVVDWKFDSVDPTNRSVDKSIANGTYDEGDAFADWVIFSASEARDNDGAGFWSNKYGWTTLDAATKFDACFTALPVSICNDAVWMLAPYRMNFYRLMLVEAPDDDTLDQTPIAFECFAENYDHAVDQAENAYPGCKVLGMDI
jgi:hypothetical protein